MDQTLSAQATAGTPLRRARSFHRARATSNELGEPGRPYHGRAMASLSLKDHTSLSLQLALSRSSIGEVGTSCSHAAASHRGPSPPPACGTPVRRARSFQRVLSPRRERSSSLPGGGGGRAAGAAGGTEASSACTAVADAGSSSSGSGPTPFPLAGRPVRRAGSFQRVVSPRRSTRSEPRPWQ